MTRHLLHIGYPKAGSTFLQRWFEGHPQLAYREGGIAGYHDVYQIAREGTAADDGIRYRVTSTEYLSIPTPDAGRLTVDFAGRLATDVAAAQRRVCRTLSELFPDAVVLIVTRGYRSMILSSYSQFVRSGGAADLSELVALTRAADLDRIAPWKYDRLIALYTSAFGEANVIVMPYELLRDDALRFTGALAARLGIEPHSGAPGRINESLSPAEMYWYPRLAKLTLALRWRRLYSLHVRASFTNRLGKPIAILERLRPHARVTDSMIPDELVEQFRGHGELLRANPLFAAYARDYLLDDYVQG